MSPFVSYYADFFFSPFSALSQNESTLAARLLTPSNLPTRWTIQKNVWCKGVHQKYSLFTWGRGLMSLFSDQTSLTSWRIHGRAPGGEKSSTVWGRHTHLSVWLFFSLSLFLKLSVFIKYSSRTRFLYTQILALFHINMFVTEVQTLF